MIGSAISPQNKARVYVSGFAEEFHREMRAVEELIHALGLQVPSLSGTGGLISEMLALYEKQVRESDVLIAIYGSAIGGMVPDRNTASHSDMPYLEWDYRMAEEEGIPVLAFVQEVKFRDDRLTHLLERIISRKGAYKFKGQKDLIEGIRTKLLDLRLNQSEGGQNRATDCVRDHSEEEDLATDQLRLEDASKPAPKVLISYAWEDEPHKLWVRALGTRLCADGIEVVLDQWSTGLGDQLPAFMEKSVRDSDFVVFVCTPTYKEKSDKRQGGVGYEGHIITAEIFSSNNHGKFIPVLKRERWDAAMPTWAKGKRGVDLRGDPWDEGQYEELLQYLHGLTPKPPKIGPAPAESRFTRRQTSCSSSSTSAEQSADKISRVPEMQALQILVANTNLEGEAERNLVSDDSQDDTIRASGESDIDQARVDLHSQKTRVKRFRIVAVIVLLGMIGVGVWIVTSNKPVTPISREATVLESVGGRGFTVTVNGEPIDMKLIPSGQFSMGSPPSEAGRYYGEGREHQVSVLSFYIGKYEVTQAQWRVVATELPKVKADLKPDPASSKGDSLPVEQVSWDEATEFCERLSRATGRTYRLPTEAEWEYACRARTIGSYAGSLDSMGWYTSNAGAKSHPVGTMQPNEFGLYDMHGNVWEWCMDTWHQNYSGAPTDGTAWTGGDLSIRVLRGGAWDSNCRNCRSAYRIGNTPGDRTATFGFRVVRNLATP